MLNEIHYSLKFEILSLPRRCANGMELHLKVIRGYYFKCNIIIFVYPNLKSDNRNSNLIENWFA